MHCFLSRLELPAIMDHYKLKTSMEMADTAPVIYQPEAVSNDQASVTITSQPGSTEGMVDTMTMTDQNRKREAEERQQQNNQANWVDGGDTGTDLACTACLMDAILCCNCCKDDGGGHSGSSDGCCDCDCGDCDINCCD